MRNKLIYTFNEHLKENLKNKEFEKNWKQSEPEYHLAKQVIEKRLQKNLSQRELAKRLNTSQAAISRIETMRGNPSLSLLKRIAQVLEAELQLNLK